MKRTYKYRIYPNKEQCAALQSIFWFYRFLYNSALEERKAYYKKYGKLLSYNAQAAELLEVKRQFQDETAMIHSQVLQQVLKTLDTAYSNFFRQIKKGEAAGFPRFKSETSFKSICFPQPKPDLAGGCVKKLPNNKLKVSGIPGEIKVKWHRELPGEALAKQVRIVKSAGKYYVAISCENVPQELLAPTGKTVGIDLGLNSFIMTDGGVSFRHPKPYNTSKEKLAFLNKKLARKKRGSNNRKKMLVALQRENEHIRNIREDFQHKVAKQLVMENDVICIEKLNVKGLLAKPDKPDATHQEKAEERSHKNNIQDASWSGFAAKLIYKAESAGRKVIQVDPRYTSMTCSCCGNIQKMPQDVRTYECKACFASLDRDVNAAINIASLGRRAQVAQQPAIKNIGIGMILARAASPPLSEATKL